MSKIVTFVPNSKNDMRSSAMNGVDSPTLSCSSEDDVIPCEQPLMGRVSEDKVSPPIDNEETTRSKVSYTDEERQEEQPGEQDDKRIRKDLTVLKDALEALSKLAAMDSTEYQDRLLNNGLMPVYDATASTAAASNDYGHSHHHHHPTMMDSPFPTAIQSSTSSSPAVPLSQLTHSICRLHSLVDNLTRENDQQTVEIIQLQQKLVDSHEQNQKLEKALKKLHDRNIKLRDKWKKEKSIGRKLMEQVQQRVTTNRRQQEESFQLLASRLQHHEQIMREKSSQSSGSSSTPGHTNSHASSTHHHLPMIDNGRERERCDSNTFSDLDGLQDFNDNISVGSSVSTTSLVTDDGIATVRLSRERTLTWPPVDTTSAEDATDNSPSIPTPIASNITTAMGELNNPFAAFLGPKVVHPYKLSFTGPFHLQFVKLQFPKTTTTTQAGDTSNVCNGTKTEFESAFLVCGYHGFDSTVNVKPTLGARLLELDGKKIDDSFSTIEQVEAALVQKQHNISNKKIVSVVFRNDNLDKKQKEILNTAVQEHHKKYPRPDPASVITEACSQPFLRKRNQMTDSAGLHHNNTTNNIANNKLLGFLGNFSQNSQQHHHHHTNENISTIQKSPSTEEGRSQSHHQPQGPHSPTNVSRQRSSSSSAVQQPTPNSTPLKQSVTPNSTGKQRSALGSPENMKPLNGVMGFLNFNQLGDSPRRRSSSVDERLKQHTEVPPLSSLRTANNVNGQSNNGGNRKTIPVSSPDPTALKSGVMAFLNMNPMTNNGSTVEYNEGIKFDDEDMVPYKDAVDERQKQQQQQQAASPNTNDTIFAESQQEKQPVVASSEAMVDGNKSHASSSSSSSSLGDTENIANGNSSTANNDSIIIMQGNVEGTFTTDSSDLPERQGQQQHQHALSSSDEIVVVDEFGNGAGSGTSTLVMDSNACSGAESTATATSAATNMQHNKLPASASQTAKETAEKLKSSMKSMGKMFAGFR